MGIITKSELRQNYCITEDKLQHLTLTITVAPFRRLMSVDKDKESHFVLSSQVKKFDFMSFLVTFCLNVMSQSWI